MPLRHSIAKVNDKVLDELTKLNNQLKMQVYVGSGPIHGPGMNGADNALSGPYPAAYGSSPPHQVQPQPPTQPPYATLVSPANSPQYTDPQYRYTPHTTAAPYGVAQPGPKKDKKEHGWMEALAEIGKAGGEAAAAHSEGGGHGHGHGHADGGAGGHAGHGDGGGGSSGGCGGGGGGGGGS